MLLPQQQIPANIR